jgi:uncharacterized membrane protein YraQ (UPF0718 family)
MSQKPDNDQHQKALVKQALKEGIKEWLDEQARAFGWFSMKWIGGVVIGGLIMIWLATHGWKAPQIAP